MENKEEKWIKVKDYEQYYEVSDKGNVKSLYKIPHKILKSTVRCKYLAVSFSKNGVHKTCNLHSLVANAFLEKPTGADNYVINHKNGNKFDNNLENLEWITITENNKHARDTKLNIAKTLKVSQYTSDGTFIETFNSIKEAAEKTGCSDSKISKVCKGKRNHTGGFKWKYEEFDYKVDTEPDGKSLDDYPNYIITRDGKIYSKSYKKYLSTRINSGYEYVTLYNNSKKGKDLSVHYLVGKVYIPNPDNYPMLNHKNFDKKDNRIENLEWISYSENMKHFGQKNGISVIKLDKDDNVIQTYNTIKDASVHNNISSRTITNSCNGKQKTARGFKWKFEKIKEHASPE